MERQCVNDLTTRQPLHYKWHAPDTMCSTSSMLRDAADVRGSHVKFADGIVSDKLGPVPQAIRARRSLARHRSTYLEPVTAFAGPDVVVTPLCAAVWGAVPDLAASMVVGKLDVLPARLRQVCSAAQEAYTSLYTQRRLEFCLGAGTAVVDAVGPAGERVRLHMSTLQAVVLCAVGDRLPAPLSFGQLTSRVAAAVQGDMAAATSMVWAALRPLLSKETPVSARVRTLHTFQLTASCTL